MLDDQKTVIAYTNSIYRSKAKALAEKLQCNFFSYPGLSVDDAKYLLLFNDNGLSLAFPHYPTYQPLQVDFLSAKSMYRKQFGGGKKQAIAKAIGIKQSKELGVIDATAGLGKDAFVLASLGCQITMLERSPIVAALLQDGLQRASQSQALSDVVARMELCETEAIDWLGSHNIENQTIYLDPMFPSRKKTALVNKDMQLLQALLGETDLASDLFLAVSNQPCKKIVVKRPNYAEPLANMKANYSIAGKTNRFDVYFNSSG